MNWYDISWEVRDFINDVRARYHAYATARFYKWIISKPDQGFERCLKLAVSHAHIGSTHGLVKLNDDIQLRPHPDAERDPPSPLPDTENRQRAAPPADQRESPFFRLPPEIRNTIYRLASAGRTFHVAHTAERRMAVVECQFAPWQRDSQPLGRCCLALRAFSRNQRSRIHFPPILIRGSLHKTLERALTHRFGWTAPFNASYYEPIYPMSNKLNVLTLAKTCRRMYDEVHPMIYQENCFFFSRCDEFLNFSETIPLVHLNKIRQIRISLMTANDAYYNDRSFTLRLFRRVCCILSEMESLEHLFIDYDITSTHTSNLDILVPASGISNVKNFTVVERVEASWRSNLRVDFFKHLVEDTPYKYECYVWDRTARIQARDSYTEQLYPKT